MCAILGVHSRVFIVPGSTLNDYWEGDSCSDTDGKTSDLIGEKKIYIDDINRYQTISAMVGIDDDSFVWIDKGEGYREVTGLHRTCCGWTNWVDLKPFLRTGWNTLKFKAVDSCSGGRNFNMDWGIQTCIPNGSSAAGACCSGLSRCADNVCRSSCSCNDNNLCTTSSAYDAQGNCAATAYTSGGAYCDDGNANTVKDACNGAGTCIGITLAECPSACAADVNLDGAVTTLDFSQVARCWNRAATYVLPGGTACAPADIVADRAINIKDYLCVGYRSNQDWRGLCTTSSHTLCQAPSCKGTTYYCTNQGSWAWRASTGCSDGNSCTHSDACSSGSCSGIFYNCPATTCGRVTCDGSGGCTGSYSTVPCETTSCSAGATGTACTRYCNGAGTCNTCTPTCTETTCTDGLDNDGDTRIDCADSDCAGLSGPGVACCQSATVDANCGNDDCKIESCVSNICSITNRALGATDECGTCQACNAAGGNCAGITANEGKNCNDDCSYCNAGTCSNRAAGATDECSTCNACNAAGGNCVGVTANSGKDCNDDCTSCASGSCTNRNQCAATECSSGQYCDSAGGNCQTPDASSEVCLNCATDQTTATWTLDDLATPADESNHQDAGKGFNADLFNSNRAACTPASGGRCFYSNNNPIYYKINV